MDKTIIVAIIGACATIVCAFIAGVFILKGGQKKTQAQVSEIKISIDGRMEELLEVTRGLATATGHAEGKEQERGEERARQDLTLKEK